MTQFEQTPRNTIRRLPERGNYERETVYAILDEALICHVGFAIEGKPFVIPMAFGRDGDRLFLHGSVASRLQRNLAGGVEVAVEATILDGLVLARSVFHHSMNYRSVVIFGTARQIVDDEEKMQALRALSEHLAPGRWNETREPSDAELKATSVLELPLSEASAKIRSGPPKDEPEDLGIRVWAGVVELKLTPTGVVDDPDLLPDAPPPPPLEIYDRRG
jgi:nitroimidazol reductase NimA-like FMN-containing flavoprotein (pyridoxamine 5'-phosphate oxidase superfamily)